MWVGAELGLVLLLWCLKKVFGAFFEESLLITLEQHVDHTNSPNFYTLSEIIIRVCGKGVSRVSTDK